MLNWTGLHYEPATVNGIAIDNFNYALFIDINR